MATRAIHINLSADATNFTTTIRNASNSIRDISSEFTRNLTNIRLVSLQSIEQLGNTGSAFKKLALTATASSESLKRYAEFIPKATEQLATYRATLGALNTTTITYEQTLTRNIIAEAKMANQLAAVRAQMEAFRPNVTFARLAFDATAAGLATERLVAALGNSASVVQTTSAQMQGLSTQLQVSIRQQAAFATEIGRVSQMEGNQTTRLRELNIAYDTAALATQRLQNNLAALRLQQAQARPDATLARLSFDAERASVSTQRLVANLGINATETAKNAAMQAGLGKELQVSTRLQAALATEIARVSQLEGNQTSKLRELQMAFERAGLAAQNLKNQIAGINTVTLPTAPTPGQPAGGATSNVANDSITAGMIGYVQVTLPILAATKAGMEFNAMITTNTTSFKTLLGDMEQAKTLMVDMQTMAAVTPFRTQDLAIAGTTLAQYGMTIKNVMPMLKTLGDVSMGRKERFDVIAYNFAQAMSLGRLTAIDARSMTLAGFNPITYIAKLRQQEGKTTKSISEQYPGLQAEMEATGLPIQELVKAMEMASSKGGQFYNAMLNESKTMNGQISTLKDNTVMFLGAWSKPWYLWIEQVGLPVINAALVGLKKFTEDNPLFAGWSLGIVGFIAAIPPLLFAFGGLAKAIALCKIGWATFLTGMKWSVLHYHILLAAFEFLILAEAANVIDANWKETSNMFTAFFELVDAGFLYIGVQISKFVIDSMYSLSQWGDTARAIVQSIVERKRVPVIESPGTIGLKGLSEAAKLAEKATVDAWSAATTKYLTSAETFKKGVAGKIVNDWSYIANSLNGVQKDFDPGKMDMSAFLDSVKEAGAKGESAMKSFADKIVAQAKSFREALGLFDKAVVEQISGERLYVRLQGQLKVFENWAKNMNILKAKLGAESPLYQDIAAKGPKEAGNVQGMAMMATKTPLLFEQYRQSYSKIGSISTDIAGQAVAGKEIAELRAQSVIVNINGGVVIDNIDKLVDLVTRQLKLNGLY